MDSVSEDGIEESICGLWDELRYDGRMVVDSPCYKVGLPRAVIGEGVLFPVESEGRFFLVSIPTSQVERFALALAEELPYAMRHEAEMDYCEHLSNGGMTS